MQSRYQALLRSRKAQYSIARANLTGTKLDLLKITQQMLLNLLSRQGIIWSAGSLQTIAMELHIVFRANIGWRDTVELGCRGWPGVVVGEAMTWVFELLRAVAVTALACLADGENTAKQWSFVLYSII